MRNRVFGLVVSPADRAQTAARWFSDNYIVDDDFSKVDTIVVLGGDGTMIQALHQNIGFEKPFYGMNCGHEGFLMNDFNTEDLNFKLDTAVETNVFPIEVRGTRADGSVFNHLAFNDAAITRQEGQAAKLRISVNYQVRIEELIGDGLIISTPVGSTAYNRSAGGPIIPFEAPMLAITPICAYRPRHWKGAIIPDNLHVRVHTLEADHRPVMVMADSNQERNVVELSVQRVFNRTVRIINDIGRTWSDKILNEQFHG